MSANGEEITRAEPQLLPALLEIVRNIKRLGSDSEVPTDLIGMKFLSSMQAVELVVRLEQGFSIRFAPTDFTALTDIRKLATLVEERRPR